MRILGLVLMLVGCLISLGGRIYHITQKDIYTEAQALKNLWPVWVISLFCLIGGFALAFFYSEEK